MKKTLALLLLLLLPSSASAWTTSTNWTPPLSGGWYTWNAYSVAEAGITYEVPQPNGSTTTMRVTVSAGSTGGQQYGGATVHFPAEADEVWSQFYVLYSSNYQWHTVGDKFSGWGCDTGGCGNMMELWYYGSPSMFQQYATSEMRNGVWNWLPNQSYSPTRQRNHWYTIKEHLKMNTPGAFDGVYEMWVDGQLVMSHSNVGYRPAGETNGFTKFRHVVVWGGGSGQPATPEDQYVYYGNSIVSTSPITDGQPDDVTPPYTDTNTPAKNSTGWPVASRNVSQYVRDPSNVTRSSISLTLDGDLPAKTCDSGLTCTPTGATAPSYLVTYTHGSDWTDNTLYTIAFSARDASASGNLLEETWTFRTALAAPETLAVTTTTLSNGQVGVPYSATLSATGGVSGYTWDNTTVLPAGLNVPSSGTGSWGVPTETFSGTITVRVTDAVGTTDTQDISYTVDAAEVPEYPTVEIGTVADTFVRSGDSQNYSTADLLRLYTYPVNTAANRIQMVWDLSSVAGTVPTTATLRLYMTGCSGTCGTDPYDITVHRFTGLTPVIDNASWLYYNGSTAWTGGADGGFSDAGAAEATASVTAVPGYYTIDVTDMVKAWLLDPSSNKGMLINPPASATADSDRIFASSENPTAAYRPVLFLTYVPPPTPNESLTGGILTGGVIQ